VYSPERAIEELKEVPGQCFKDIKFGKDPKKIRFPGLIENHENDFNADKSMNLFKSSIIHYNKLLTS